jgi:hypothetical protein
MSKHMYFGVTKESTNNHLYLRTGDSNDDWMFDIENKEIVEQMIVKKSSSKVR